MNYRKHYTALVLIIAALFFGYDIVSDIFDDSENMPHIIVESLVFVAVLLVLFCEILRARFLLIAVGRERKKTARLSGELLHTIQNQFSQWQLSDAESEVALLLVKGLSMKEISEARQVKEKTVRQQAANIYSKSACGGRHELAAYFIEDLISSDQA